MQKHNRQAQRFGCNSVPRIITPPLFGNLQELRPQEVQNPLMPCFANINFTNIIYTKLSTFLSRQIP